MQKREYKSKYSDSLVSEAQYLTDLMCERIAKKNKETLVRQYWKDVFWKKQFQRQVVAANALLKEFTCKEIVDALNSPRGKGIYSLGLKKPLIETIMNNRKNKDVQITHYDDTEIFADDWQDNGDIEYHGEKLPANKNKSIWSELSE